MSQRAALALAIALVASGCSRAEGTNNGIATDEGIAAIALPKAQFREMLKRSVLGTQSGATHMFALGLDQGCDVLEDALEQVVDRRLPEWRANLVTAYRDNVPAHELAKAVERSPRRARSSLQPYLPAIGTAMQQSSEELLQSAGVEVLQITGNAAEKVDPAKVDMVARQRELAQMKTSGQICGVGRWQQP